MSPDDQASLARRAEEVREIGRRLVRNLTRSPFRSFAGLPEGAVLISEALRPSDAALLDPSRLAGVATEEGGADDHTSVMLRALGVPAVLGAPGLAHAIQPGDVAVIDGVAGTVTLNPGSTTLAAARRAVTAFARERQRYAKLRRLPAETLDGEAVELQANLELPLELPLIAQSGAVGIGLLRTEFLFMNRETVPDEDTQAETYRSIVEAMGGDPVAIRVLDWGGEKDIEALSSAGFVPDVADTNPALGLRGIRMLLRHPELLETQFAAILRAAVAGPVRVMLPMVTTVAEVRAAREIYERVARRLRRRGERITEKLPPLGIMIETPGAALSADALALEADFFAIGTNDLTAYTLAVDRAETEVAELYDPLHPAVLRLVQFATEAALRMRMPVSVCGEMAANPRLTPLLLGLGLRSFSMAASAVPRVKQMVRNVEIDACARFSRRVMEQSDPARIEEVFADFAARPP
jgi:phosphotransferase system enzyme I (PtsI)